MTIDPVGIAFIVVGICAALLISSAAFYELGKVVQERDMLWQAQKDREGDA